MIRITGMNSGLDTDSIIKELIKAKSDKLNTLKKSKTKLEWKQTKWKDLNTYVKSLVSRGINMPDAISEPMGCYCLNLLWNKRYEHLCYYCYPKVL